MKRWSLLLLGLIGCGAAAPPGAAQAPVVEPSAASAASECERRKQAVELSNEGDRLVKVDVDGAIGKYAGALDLDPANHDVMWKLSAAYERKEDWANVASALARSQELAPEFASYAHRQGKALLQLARGGDEKAYAAAREPLERCVAADPNYASCYFLLGEIEEQAEQLQRAAERYTQAVQREPLRAEYYVRLSQLYRAVRLNADAEAVLREGVRIIPRGARTDGELCQMYFALSRMAKARKDQAAELAALEQAEALVDAASPELLFEIGGSLSLYPEHKQRAFKLLVRFAKVVCSGAGAAAHKDSCQTAAYLIAGLGK